MFERMVPLILLYRVFSGLYRAPTGGVFSTHKEPLVKWLKGLIDREEVSGCSCLCTHRDPHYNLPPQTTVNIVQLMDFLTNKGVSKEEVLEVRATL